MFVRDSEISKHLGKEFANGVEATIHFHTGNETLVIRKEKIKNDKEVLEAKKIEVQLDNKYVVSLKSYSNNYSIYDKQEGGDLQSFMAKRHNEIPSLEARLNICQDILLGLNYLHSKEYVHGDIKPDNILLGYTEDSPNNLVAKLADFGRTLPLSQRQEGYADRYYPSEPVSRLYAKGVDRRFLDIHAICFVLLSVLAWHEEILCQPDEEECRNGVDFPLLEISSKNMVYLEELNSSDSHKSKYYEFNSDIKKAIDDDFSRNSDLMARVWEEIKDLLKTRGGISIEDLGDINPKNDHGLHFGKEIWKGIMGADFTPKGTSTSTEKLLKSLYVYRSTHFPIIID